MKRQTGPRNPPAGRCACRSFRSSSRPSTSATTSPRCTGGWRRRSPASPGKSCSSTTIRPTAPGTSCAIWRERDTRVRCIRRIGRRGLSGACIEGILASSAPFAAVIDADLQHDETQLPKMLALLQGGEADLVVGSRYIEGGSADSFNKQRAGASALATEVAKRVLRVKIADPMSGFFMIRRDRFEQLAPQLSTQGFKILLDIVATARGELARQGNSLHLRHAAAWREQARLHGGAGFPRAGAGETHRRRGVAALPPVRDGRRRPASSCISPTLFVALEAVQRAVCRRRRPAAPSSP